MLYPPSSPYSINATSLPNPSGVSLFPDGVLDPPETSLQFTHVTRHQEAPHGFIRAAGAQYDGGDKSWVNFLIGGKGGQYNLRIGGEGGV
jgi:hypothetical protein